MPIEKPFDFFPCLREGQCAVSPIREILPGFFIPVQSKKGIKVIEGQSPEQESFGLEDGRLLFRHGSDHSF